MSIPKKALATGAILLAIGLAGCDSDLTVPMPEAQDRQEVTAQLAKAAQAQGVCYGWSLDGSTGLSLDDANNQGSSLGDNVGVDADPRRCPKWVRVRASITYQPESSESEDSAYIWVDTSSDLTAGPAIRRGLERFGLDEMAFVDDPALAISRAVLALPLLSAEAGIVEPAPTPPAPAAAPPALDEAGSDFWRDRAGYVIAAAIMLVLAGLFLYVGFHQRTGVLRRSGRLNRPKPTAVARAGKAAAGRASKADTTSGTKTATASVRKSKRGGK